MIVAVDFDGTIVEEGSSPLKVRDGAVTALRRLASAGHRLILHTCRLTDPDAAADAEGRSYADAAEQAEGRAREAEMLTFLAETGLDRILVPWRGRGKPPADLYVDDRALQGRIGRPTGWRDLAAMLGS